MLCPYCRYEMKGVPGEVCPECGDKSRPEQRTSTSILRSNWLFAAFVGNIVLLLSLTGLFLALGILTVGSQSVGWALVIVPVLWICCAAGIAACYTTAHRYKSAVTSLETFEIHPLVWFVVWSGPVGSAAYLAWTVLA